ncbi:MAG: HAF repeat-containing protein [Massilia sp.]
MLHSRSLGRLLALAACCLSLHAQADPRYSVTVVGTADSVGYGINASGQVVGYLTTLGGNEHAFLYNNISTLDLGTLGGITSVAYGISDAGQVVGGAENVAGYLRPFSYAGGTMSDLGTLGGPSGFASAINNHGQIVGLADTAAAGPRAFLVAGGTMQDLGTLPSSGEFYSNANAINDHGKIAGGSSAGEFTPPEPPFHAFVRCCDGRLTDLGTFGGQYSEAFGINELGEVVGVAATASLMTDHAFLYSHGVMHDIGTLEPGGEGYAEAFDINNLSQAVGRAFGSAPTGLGFLYEGGAMVALDTLIDPTSGWTVVDARSINDAQQIAGTACMAGLCHAVRLDLVSPVPEPDAAAMLVAGLALVGARLQRRPQRKQLRE